MRIRLARSSGAVLGTICGLGVVAGVVLLVGVCIVGWLLLWGFVAQWLWSGLAPEEWVRPTLWQWTLIILLLHVVFGGSGAVVRSS